jgi:hypothetical protein
MTTTGQKRKFIPIAATGCSSAFSDLHISLPTDILQCPHGEPSWHSPGFLRLRNAETRDGFCVGFDEAALRKAGIAELIERQQRHDVILFPEINEGNRG